MIEHIQQTVCDYYGITLDDMLGPCRKQKFVLPRQMAMALARELTDFTLPQLAEYFHRDDHTTIMHAVARIKSFRQIDGSKIDVAYDVLKYRIVGSEGSAS